MNFDLDKLMEKGAQVAASVKKTAVDLADKGKKQVELVNAQSKLSKAQRQLGALVYSLVRNSEENKELVNKYVQAIAEIEQEIEDLKTACPPEEPVPEAGQPKAAEARTCPQCGVEVEEDALFCNKCGAQL